LSISENFFAASYLELGSIAANLGFTRLANVVHENVPSSMFKSSSFDSRLTFVISCFRSLRLASFHGGNEIPCFLFDGGLANKDS
uniref:XPGI domain-containing protein n=1 Tax=Haemonchus placei TaxID=6290 RepID=A0A0N4WIV6_HAEPC